MDYEPSNPSAADTAPFHHGSPPQSSHDSDVEDVHWKRADRSRRGSQSDPEWVPIAFSLDDETNLTSTSESLDIDMSEEPACRKISEKRPSSVETYDRENKRRKVQENHRRTKPSSRYKPYSIAARRRSGRGKQQRKVDEDDPAPTRHHQQVSPKVQQLTSPRSSPSAHSQQPRTNKDMFPRRTYLHQPKVGALCIDHDGYTVSDGVFSISEDQQGDGWTRCLLEDLDRLGLQKVFLVDSLTERKFKTVVPPPRVLGYTDLSSLGCINVDHRPPLMKPCETCRQMRCHRWRAIEYGVQLMMNYIVDTIPH